MGLEPFADECTALRLGDMNVENRLDRVSLYGSVDLTKDRTGLQLARELHAMLGSVVAALEREGEALPDAVQPASQGNSVRNPFG